MSAAPSLFTSHRQVFLRLPDMQKSAPGLPTHPRGSPLLTPPDTHATATAQPFAPAPMAPAGVAACPSCLPQSHITLHPASQVFVEAPHGHPTG